MVNDYPPAVAFLEPQFVRYDGIVMTYRHAKKLGAVDMELVECPIRCAVCGETRRGVAYLGCRCDRQAYEERRDWQEYREV